MIRVKPGKIHTLCATCERGTVTKREDGTEFAYCSLMQRHLPFAVSECTDWEAKGTMSRYEMEKIAWIIDPKPGIGFIKPRTNRHRELRNED